jgi:hypothetical protein
MSTGEYCNYLAFIMVEICGNSYRIPTASQVPPTVTKNWTLLALRKATKLVKNASVNGKQMIAITIK